MSLDQRAREISECLHALITEDQRTNMKMRSIFDSYGPQEFHLLMTVGRAGSCIMSDLAKAMQLAVSSITGIVDKLEAKNAVRRYRSAEDRRIVQVTLTDQGAKDYKAAMEGHLEFARNILRPLDAHEQEVFLALFRKVADSVRTAGKE